MQISFKLPETAYIRYTDYKAGLMTLNGIPCKFVSSGGDVTTLEFTYSQLDPGQTIDLDCLIEQYGEKPVKLTEETPEMDAAFDAFREPEIFAADLGGLGERLLKGFEVGANDTSIVSGMFSVAPEDIAAALRETVDKHVWEPLYRLPKEEHLTPMEQARKEDALRDSLLWCEAHQAKIQYIEKGLLAVEATLLKDWDAEIITTSDLKAAVWLLAQAQTHALCEETAGDGPTWKIHDWVETQIMKSEGTIKLFNIRCHKSPLEFTKAVPNGGCAIDPFSARPEYFR